MRYLALMSLVSLSLAFAQKKPQLKQAEIEVLEVTASRADDRLTVDGRLRNAGERPVRKLVLIIEVLDGDKNVLSRQSGSAEDEDLDAAQESEFHVQMGAHARAVHIRLLFEDGAGRDIRGIKAGPFSIE